MELHRNERDNRLLALKSFALAIGAIAVGGLGLVIGGPLGGYLVVLLWILGAFILLVSIVLFVLTFGRFRVAFRDDGLLVQANGVDCDVPWHLVEAVNIERVGVDEDSWALVVWLADSVPMKHRPTYPVGGARQGYVVTPLAEIRESREELAAIVARYAGERFRSGAVA